MNSRVVNSGTDAAVPVIDLGPLLDPCDLSAARRMELAVVRQIGKACEEWGFFQVVNHGIPVDLIEDMLATSLLFFECPAQEKMKVRAQAARGADRSTEIPTGYNAYPPCIWDSYENLYYQADPAACNTFPKDLPQLRLVIEKLLVFLSQTAEFIESLISQSLGLPANFLKEFNGDKIQPFKVLCYPRSRSQEQEIGAQEHQDSSCITLVGQDETGGYQVLNDGKWVWTNNRFKSAVHRVLNNKERRRCSFAFGSIPNPDMIVSPLPQFTTNVNCPAAYKAFLYRDYMVKRIHNKTHPPTTAEDFVTISIYALRKMIFDSNTMKAA